MKCLYTHAIALALVSAAYGRNTLAQESPVAGIAQRRQPRCSAAPMIPAPGAKAQDTPALMVMGFESGTVSAQIRDKRGLMSILGGKHRGSYDSYDPAQLGVGIADMLIEKLLASGQFRLIERKSTVAGSGAQFLVTGSVTRFGFEQRNVGGLLATVATMGMVGYKQHKTEVALTRAHHQRCDRRDRRQHDR